MAWYDSLISGLNTAGNLWNAASPLINTGASLYNRNQTQGAISNAFQDYSGYVTQGLDKYQGFVDQGLSKYADYTKSAMDDYKLASQEGIGAIKDVQGALSSAYSTSLAHQAPYTRAGNQAVSGYQSLLQDPSKIVDDPGYQFRLDQGSEALRRNAAATGFRGSGNQQIALQEYGQNYATNELDRSLNRYTPLINAGVQAAGNVVNAGSTYSAGMANTGNSLAQMYDSYGRVSAGMQQGLGAANAAAYQGLGQAYSGAYEGLGEAAAGSQVGQAGADTAFLRDVLGMDVNPLSAAGDVAGGVRDVLTQGGSSAGPSMGGGESVAGGQASGAITGAAGTSWLSSGAAAQGANAMGIAGSGALAADAALGTMASTPLSAGVTGQGMAAMAPGGQGMAAMFPGSGGTMATGTAGGAGAGTAGGAGAGTGAGATSFGSWVGSMAGPMAFMAAVAALSNSAGGAADKTKTGDVTKIFENEGAEAGWDKVGKIITGKEWSGETSTNIKHVINPLAENGAIGADFPAFHSADSEIDLWNVDPITRTMPVDGPPSMYTEGLTRSYDYRTGRNAPLAPQLIAQTYGLSPEETAQYTSLANNAGDDPNNGSLVYWASTHLTPDRKTATAQNIYTGLRGNGYQGDLSKIESLFGGNVTSPGNFSTTYLP